MKSVTVYDEPESRKALFVQPESLFETMYDYQLNQDYFAQVADDMLDIGCEELAKLGAENIRPAYRGVYFNASRPVMYRVNYEPGSLRG